VCVNNAVKDYLEIIIFCAIDVGKRKGFYNMGIEEWKHEIQGLSDLDLADKLSNDSSNGEYKQMLRDEALSRIVRVC